MSFALARHGCRREIWSGSTSREAPICHGRSKSWSKPRQAGLDSGRWRASSITSRSSYGSWMRSAMPPEEIEGTCGRPPATEYYSTAVTPSAPEEGRRLIQDALIEIAGRGRAAIVAHAASMALAERPDVLRVHVTASRRRAPDGCDHEQAHQRGRDATPSNRIDKRQKYLPGSSSGSPSCRRTTTSSSTPMCSSPSVPWPRCWRSSGSTPERASAGLPA